MVILRPTDMKAVDDPQSNKEVSWSIEMSRIDECRVDGVLNNVRLARSLQCLFRQLFQRVRIPHSEIPPSALSQQ
jgi:hypothetical protein